MANASSASSPKLVGMKYLVEEVLSTDKAATVLRIADQKGLGKKYALKVVKREEPEDDVAVSLARMSFEASGRVGHSALVDYHDFRLRKSWFRVTRAELLMEYVEGVPLERLEPLKVGPWVLIFRQVAEALAHLHRRKVCHGDLTATRVVLTRSGEVKVFGYGRAPVKSGDKVQVVASRDYMAPEMIKEKRIDEKTDLYAFGATMYRVLTGQPANLGSRVVGEAGKITNPVSLNPSIPAQLNNLIIGCLQSKPERRPESAYDVKLALDALSQELATDPAALKGLTALKKG
jgi:eukaryotic-like serine/threonine-protein kinase